MGEPPATTYGELMGGPSPPPTVGASHYRIPEICKHFGWDPAKICGPTLFAQSEHPEANCCFGHTLGCTLHKARPLVNGRPFVLSEHSAKLEELGLIVRRPELAALRNQGKKPPGVPRKIGDALVYPLPHFA